jgi:hypothetical protein
MAKTTKRRRRKHRGTQSGRIDRTGRATRPKTRAQAKAQMKKGRQVARDMPPTWSGAIKRAAVAAAVFFATVAFAFKQAIGPSIGLAAAMMLIYVPMGYAFDTLLYRRRERSRQKAREERAG